MNMIDAGGRGIPLSVAGLAKAAILPNRRLPNVITSIGDSEVSAIYLDSADGRSLGGRSALNWANALLGQPFTMGRTFGVSGERTDQFFARMPAVLATNAGVLYYWGGINNVGAVGGGGSYVHAVTGQTVTIANVAAVVIDDITKQLDMAIAAGMAVVAECVIQSETAANALQTAAIAEINQALYEMSETKAGLLLNDARADVQDPVASDTSAVFATINGAKVSSDGTHENPRGSFYHALGRTPTSGLQRTLLRLDPRRRTGVVARNRNELPSNGRRQLLLNPIGQSASGGILSNGATGTVLNGYTLRRDSPNTTLTGAVIPHPEGIGNMQQLDATFTAGGEQVQFWQDVLAANYAEGDWLEMFADVRLLGAAGGGGAPTGLASAFIILQQSTGSGGQVLDNFCLVHGASTEPGPDAVCNLTLKTRPFRIRPNVGAGSFLTARFRAMSFAAGSARIAVQIGVRRRISGY